MSDNQLTLTAAEADAVAELAKLTADGRDVPTVASVVADILLNARLRPENEITTFVPGERERHDADVRSSLAAAIELDMSLEPPASGAGDSESDDAPPGESLEVTDEIVERAQERFWSAVADAYPQIKTGDFDPMATFRFEEACREAVRSWVDGNRPYEESGAS